MTLSGRNYQSLIWNSLEIHKKNGFGIVFLYEGRGGLFLPKLIFVTLVLRGIDKKKMLHINLEQFRDS